MVLATRCPHCATAFRVVPDQIKLRGGWVRCGVCNEVFDAGANLLQDPPSEPGVAQDRPTESGIAQHPPTEPGIVQHQPSEPHVVRRRGEGLVVPSTGGDDEQEDAPSSDAPPARLSATASLEEPAGDALARDVPASAVPAGDEPAQPTLATAPHENPADRSTGQPSSDGLPSVLRSGRPLPPPAPAPLVAESRTRGGPALDFLDEEDRRRRRRAQWWWGAAGLVALLALLAQLVWIFRAELATRVPALRPVLEGMCERLDCTVGYPRAPELLVIESSSIEPWSPQSPAVADKGEAGEPAEVILPVRRLALRMVLRNRAEFPQSWPAIELALMDLSDAVVARRILQPSVYLSPQDLAEPLGPLQERVLRIPVETIDAHATGYRVAIFYP